MLRTSAAASSVGKLICSSVMAATVPGVLLPVDFATESRACRPRVQGVG